MNNRETGAQGERAAEAYLVGRGAKVLARNWSCKAGELDLVVWMENRYVFVEVKRRASDRFGAPSEAVGSAKQRHIRIAAQWYMKTHGIVDARVRFDVVEVLDGRVRHIPGAF